MVVVIENSQIIGTIEVGNTIREQELYSTSPSHIITNFVFVEDISLYEYINETFSLKVNYLDIKAEQEVLVLEGLKLASKEKLEDEIQNYIIDKVQSLGYDDENSIAKYLVDGNDFYAECRALSLWIGAVWTYVISVQADVESAIRTIPTIEELIAELPIYTIV